MKLAMECPMCGKKNVMTLTEIEAESVHVYRNSRVLIQDLFPDFNPMEREFIKTGYCPECQSMLFGTNYTSARIKEAQ